MLREVYHTVKITQKQVLSLSNKVAYGAQLSCRVYSPMAVKGLIRTFDSYCRLSARTKRLKMKIVVFPLNCLILMEQGARSDL